jgi:hypothetical protein
MVVGVKMMTHGWLKALLGPNFNFWILGIIAAILAAGVVASLLRRTPGVPRRISEDRAAGAATGGGDGGASRPAGTMRSTRRFE